MLTKQTTRVSSYLERGLLAMENGLQTSLVCYIITTNWIVLAQKMLDNIKIGRGTIYK